jgi:hypothetical protein
MAVFDYSRKNKIKWIFYRRNNIMSSLKVYYFNTKNPSSSCQVEEKKLTLVFHPPVFVLNVHNSVLSQKTNTVILFFFVGRYYLIIHEIISPREHAYIEANARAPPLYELIGGYYV